MPYDVVKLKNAGKIDWILSIKEQTKIGKLFNGIKQKKSKLQLIKDFIFCKDNLFDTSGSPLIELLMETQSKLAHFQTQFLLGDNYIRINPLMKSSIELDDVSKLESLKNIADINKQQLEKIKTLLGG